MLRNAMRAAVTDTAAKVRVGSAWLGRAGTPAPLRRAPSGSTL